MRSPRQRCLAPRATSANIGSLTSAIGGVGELADIRVTWDSGRKGAASARQCRAIKLCNSASNEVSMAHPSTCQAMVRDCQDCAQIRQLQSNACSSAPGPIRTGEAPMRASRRDDSRRQKLGTSTTMHHAPGQIITRWTRLFFMCAALLNSDLASAEEWLALTLAPDGTW